jgi:hypothetical protein
MWTYAFFAASRICDEVLFHLPSIIPSKKTADNFAVVTDYSNQKLIDGYKAYYVMVVWSSDPWAWIHAFAEETVARKFSGTSGKR